MIGTYYIKQALEIFFFSGIVYGFSLWLKNDKRTNLLLYFYGYYIIFSCAFFLDLTTVSLFLLYSSPLALLLFIIFHQDVLQRNFIALTKTRDTCSNPTEQWLENLIRICLHQMNNNSCLYIVIENHSDLKPFIQSDYLLNSPISLELLSLVIESPHFDSKKIIWCSSTGTLIGLNGSWHMASDSSQQSAIPSWQQEALLMTLKTDTIVFKVNSTKRSFEVVLKGIMYDAISASQIVPFIKKNLHSWHQPIQKGELNNDRQNSIKKQSSQQPNG